MVRKESSPDKKVLKPIDIPNEPPALGCKGMTLKERRDAHRRWVKMRPMMGPEENREYEEGRQCMMCAFYVPLESDIGMDWGVCANPKSRHDGTLVFEHHACMKREFRGNEDDEEEDD